MWSSKYREDLLKKRESVNNLGGTDRIEKQHTRGKLTARERVELLFDKDTFIEVGALRKSTSSKDNLYGEGVVTGFGNVNGRKVFVASQDFTYHGGTLGIIHADKIAHIMDMAMDNKCPFVTINDSGGARIEEGVCSLSGYARIMRRNAAASGVIPQIAVIMGTCAGGACYSPAMCDFVFITKEHSQMFITGPDIVRSFTGEVTTADMLGGSYVHSSLSGVAHFLSDSEEQCMGNVRELLSYLPSSCFECPPRAAPVDADRSLNLEDVVPDNMRKPYDIRKVIELTVDEKSFFEVSSNYARNVVVGFSRIEGNTVGIVANQPQVFAGVLDVNASDKASRFVRFCDSFNIPILTLVDVPGYMPGEKQEHTGIIRHGAKLLYSYAEATVPKVTLLLRKAFGGAFIAMGSKEIGADLVYAWPIAQIAVMGAEGAVGILNKREIAASPNPEMEKKKLKINYEEKYFNPYIAAENGFVDEVILPEETRHRICTAFKVLLIEKKPFFERKHGNIPL